MSFMELLLPIVIIVMIIGILLAVTAKMASNIPGGKTAWEWTKKMGKIPIGTIFFWIAIVVLAGLAFNWFANLPATVADSDDDQSLEDWLGLTSLPAESWERISDTDDEQKQWKLIVHRPDDIRLRLPANGWHRFQIEVIRTPHYHGSSVPPEGWRPTEIGLLAHGRGVRLEDYALQEATRASEAIRQRPGMNFLATYYQVDGEEAKALTQRQEFSSLEASTITLGVNDPSGESTAEIAFSIETEE